ncbi:hypothetical protein ACFQUU_10675 [Herbaspirillum sp. GCM10030257]|uniref:hypothetical protein n=1 Tax=Herbaspirillum sp. GCM10030257 TaxID=3273393 RepID=UPI003608C00B
MRSKGKKTGLIDDPQVISHPKTFEDDVRSLLGPDIELLNGWRIQIKRLDARSDESNLVEYDLSKYWLPPNNVYPRPQTLTSQPTLAASVVLAINEYLIRARAEKSRHKRGAMLLTTIVKFFEYSWLSNRYQFNQWEKSDYQKLATKLASGGWQRALDVQHRFAKYCIDASKSD